jgi:hypothetical protein
MIGRWVVRLLVSKRFCQSLHHCTHYRCCLSVSVRSLLRGTSEHCVSIDPPGFVVKRHAVSAQQPVRVCIQRACAPPRSVPCGSGGKISAFRCGVPHLVLLTREVTAWQEKAVMLRSTRVSKRHSIGRLSLYLFASSYTLPCLRRDLHGSCSGFHQQLGRIAANGESRCIIWNTISKPVFISYGVTRTPSRWDLFFYGNYPGTTSSQLSPT